MKLSDSIKIVIFSLLLLFLSGNIMAQSRSEYRRLWKSYEKERRFEEAVPVFKRAIKEHPKDPWFYIFVAHSYKKIKKYSESIPYFEKALLLSPDNEGIVRNVYYGYLSYAGYKGFREKDWNGAMQWYKMAILVDPEKYQAYNLMGNAKRNGGKLNEGLKFLKKAYLLNPEHIKSKGLGANFRVTLTAGLTQKDHDKALHWTDLALKAYPENRKILSLCAVVSLKSSRKGILQKIYGVNKNPDTLKLLKGIEAIYEGQNSAEESLKKLSFEAPNDFDLDDLIGRTIRLKLRDLDYYVQMKHPLQDLAVWFFHRSVEKYFKVNPYTQKVLLTPPLKGHFCSTQGAGGRSFHYGLKGHFSYDLSLCGKSAMGVPVYSVTDGIVEKVRQNQPDNPEKAKVNLKAKANYITIRHGDIVSLYVHLKKGSALVRKGERVKKGQKIGLIGNSGVSGGPHLHFIMRNGKGVSIEPIFEGLTGHPRRGGSFQTLKTLRAYHKYYVK